MPDALASRSPLRWFSTSHRYTASSAAMLLMLSSFLSGILGLLRTKVVNSLWGASLEQDAYQAAFGLPDLVSYFLIGSAASISVITILNRYREANNPEAEDRALSVIFSTMFVVLAAGVLLGELVAPGYVWLFNKGFRVDPARFALCTSLTRWMLPAQLFFFAGSVISSRLQVRKIFIYQAFTPVVYNAGIILGAIFLHRQLGVYSLAVGVLAGSLIGSTIINTIAAFRTGLHFHPLVNFRAPDFREWLRLSLPLMVGVSLVMADRFIINYFASIREGGISLVINAKFLFNAPFSILGPAVGAASLPFFTSLYQQGRAADFSASVNRAITRLFAAGLLVSAAMIAFAPWFMDLFRGGKFHHADVLVMTHLFVLFAVTLAIWAVQGIYARAFYAASDTVTPTITGIIATLLFIPIYWILFRSFDLTGLAIASDFGIFVQTAALAILLHKRRLVSLTQLDFSELAKAALAAIVSGFGAYLALAHLPASLQPDSHLHDLIVLVAGGALWALTALATLLLTGSKLPTQTLRRR